MVSLRSSWSPANKDFNAAFCLLSLQRKRGSFFLCSLKARGSYRVSYPALLPIQHFDRHGLVRTQTPPRWMCQRNGVLGSMSWQFSKGRVEGRQLPTTLIWCHLNARQEEIVPSSLSGLYRERFTFKSKASCDHALVVVLPTCADSSNEFYLPFTPSFSMWVDPSLSVPISRTLCIRGRHV